MDIGNQWCLCDLNSTVGTLKVRFLNSGLNVQCHFDSTWASSTVIIDITAYTELNIIVKSPRINLFFVFHIEILLISICAGFSWDRVGFSFTVSGMMLCFGFKRKPMLIMYWCFCCCWAMPYRAKDFSVSQLLVLLWQWGAQFFGKGHNLQLTYTSQRDISYHMTSCEKKLDSGGKLAGGAVIAWGLAGHLLAGGEQLSCISLILYICIVYV